jgi:anti-sigma B factor antagonist
MADGAVRRCVTSQSAESVRGKEIR